MFIQNKIGILLLACSFLAGGTVNGQDFGKMAIHSSRHWLDIDYIDDHIIGHKLDIHLPHYAKNHYPVVICIYGSAWFSSSGKSHTFTDGLGQTLLDHGFAVVSINHRSSHDAKFPAQIQDVKAAIRFIRAHSEAFSLDTSFVAVTGWSSGGHLAAMAGTTGGLSEYEYNKKSIDLVGGLGNQLAQSDRIDAVVDWFGPTDFLIMDECGSSFSHDAEESPESSLIGGAIQDHPAACALADPATYINASNPPFLILHGDKDNLVPSCQSEYLHEELQAAGVSSELIIVEGGGHGPGVMIETYYDKMVKFLSAQIGQH